MKSLLTRTIQFSVCSLVGVCIIGGASASGQISSSPSTPTPGDPEVFGLFLRYHDRLTRDIESSRSKDPQAARLLHHRMAASFGVSALDFSTINTVYSAMKSQFDALDAEAALYTNQGRRRDPDFAVLQEFETRRQKILADGLKKLQMSISPASWKGLQAYVDGEYRKGVRRSSVGGSPSANGQVTAGPPNQ